MSYTVRIYWNQNYSDYNNHYYYCDGQLDFGKSFWSGSLRDITYIILGGTRIECIKMDRDYFKNVFCGHSHNVYKNQFEDGIEYRLTFARELKKLLLDSYFISKEWWEIKANLVFINEMPDETICMISIL